MLRNRLTYPSTIAHGADISREVAWLVCMSLSSNRLYRLRTDGVMFVCVPNVMVHEAYLCLDGPLVVLCLTCSMI